jgi:folate-dependent phosphoribosylglycinamide formyltransferase PurN
MLELQKAAHAARGASVAVGVLGSTRGSSLQPILRALASGVLKGAHVALVVSNKADAPILERARQHGIPAEHQPLDGRSREAYDAALTSRFEAHGVQLVLCVGWMRILSPAFVGRWRRRALNVPPARAELAIS